MWLFFLYWNFFFSNHWATLYLLSTTQILLPTLSPGFQTVDMEHDLCCLLKKNISHLRLSRNKCSHLNVFFTLPLIISYISYISVLSYSRIHVLLSSPDCLIFVLLVRWLAELYIIYALVKLVFTLWHTLPMSEFL